MRVGAPARRHGVADDDMLHAARTAMRRVVMDDDLTMLIGPAMDGALLEVGILDIWTATTQSSFTHGTQIDVLPVPDMR